MQTIRWFLQSLKKANFTIFFFKKRVAEGVAYDTHDFNVRTYYILSLCVLCTLMRFNEITSAIFFHITLYFDFLNLYLRFQSHLKEICIFTFCEQFFKGFFKEKKILSTCINVHNTDWLWWWSALLPSPHSVEFLMSWWFW